MTKRKKLYDKIHAEMRKLAILRHPRCVCCKGASGDLVLQGGHLITKSCTSTRFDMMNVFTQCRSCNNKHEYRPEIFTQWFIRTFGQEVYDELVEKSKQLKKYSLKDLEELLEDYKKQTKEKGL